MSSPAAGTRGLQGWSPWDTKPTEARDGSVQVHPQVPDGRRLRHRRRAFAGPRLRSADPLSRVRFVGSLERDRRCRSPDLQPVRGVLLEIAAPKTEGGAAAVYRGLD